MDKILNYTKLDIENNSRPLLQRYYFKNGGDVDMNSTSPNYLTKDKMLFYSNDIKNELNEVVRRELTFSLDFTDLQFDTNDILFKLSKKLQSNPSIAEIQEESAYESHDTTLTADDDTYGFNGDIFGKVITSEDFLNITGILLSIYFVDDTYKDNDILIGGVYTYDKINMDNIKVSIISKNILEIYCNHIYTGEIKDKKFMVEINHMVSKRLVGNVEYDETKHIAFDNGEYVIYNNNQLINIDEVFEINPQYSISQITVSQKNTDLTDDTEMKYHLNGVSHIPKNMISLFIESDTVNTDKITTNGELIHFPYPKKVESYDVLMYSTHMMKYISDVQNSDRYLENILGEEIGSSNEFSETDEVSLQYPTMYKLLLENNKNDLIIEKVSKDSDNGEFKCEDLDLNHGMVLFVNNGNVVIPENGVVKYNKDYPLYFIYSNTFKKDNLELYDYKIEGTKLTLYSKNENDMNKLLSNLSFYTIIDNVQVPLRGRVANKSNSDNIAYEVQFDNSIIDNYNTDGFVYPHNINDGLYEGYIRLRNVINNRYKYNTETSEYESSVNGNYVKVDDDTYLKIDDTLYLDSLADKNKVYFKYNDLPNNYYKLGRTYIPFLESSYDIKTVLLIMYLISNSSLIYGTNDIGNNVDKIANIDGYNCIDSDKLKSYLDNREYIYKNILSKYYIAIKPITDDTNDKLNKDYTVSNNVINSILNKDSIEYIVYRGNWSPKSQLSEDEYGNKYYLINDLIYIRLSDIFYNSNKMAFCCNFGSYKTISDDRVTNVYNYISILNNELPYINDVEKISIGKPSGETGYKLIMSKSGTVSTYEIAFSRVETDNSGRANIYEYSNIKDSSHNINDYGNKFYTDLDNSYVKYIVPTNMDDLNKLYGDIIHYDIDTLKSEFNNGIDNVIKEDKIGFVASNSSYNSTNSLPEIDDDISYDESTVSISDSHFLRDSSNNLLVFVDGKYTKDYVINDIVYNQLFRRNGVLSFSFPLFRRSPNGTHYLISGHIKRTEGNIRDYRTHQIFATTAPSNGTIKLWNGNAYTELVVDHCDTDAKYEKYDENIYITSQSNIHLYRDMDSISYSNGIFTVNTLTAKKLNERMLKSDVYDYPLSTKYMIFMVNDKIISPDDIKILSNKRFVLSDKILRELDTIYSFDIFICNDVSPKYSNIFYNVYEYNYYDDQGIALNDKFKYCVLKDLFWDKYRDRILDKYKIAKDIKFNKYYNHELPIRPIASVSYNEFYEAIMKQFDLDRLNTSVSEDSGVNDKNNELISEIDTFAKDLFDIYTNRLAYRYDIDVIDDRRFIY